MESVDTHNSEGVLYWDGGLFLHTLGTDSMGIVYSTTVP